MEAVKMREMLSMRGTAMPAEEPSAMPAKMPSAMLSVCPSSSSCTFDSVWTL